MGCNSSYMDPTQKERNSLEVIGLLKELKQNVGHYDKSYGRVESLDADVATLCSLCQKIDVSKQSLELQIWWRDHKKADKQRVREELKSKKDKVAKNEAIKKLSKYERKLLGVDNLAV